MLPNFFCIGAQKCGTTSLWKILAAHPDVFLASPRETKFFHDDLQFAEGPQCYEHRYFSHWSGQTAVGEKCPEYLYVPSVAERIRRTLGPDVRFVVTLRSPAQRAFSHYRHNLTALREGRTFDEAISEEAELLTARQPVPVPFGYLGRGLYAEQLTRFFRHFDRGQFLIVDFDSHICGDQRALTHRLCGFLEIRRFFPPGLPFREGRPRLDQLRVRVHESNDRKQCFVEIKRRTAPMKRRLKRWLGRQPATSDEQCRICQPSDALIRVARHLEKVNTAELVLTREKELEINNQYFQADIEALRSLTSIDVVKWLDGTSTRAKPDEGSRARDAA